MGFRMEILHPKHEIHNLEVEKSCFVESLNHSKLQSRSFKRMHKRWSVMELQYKKNFDKES